MKADQARKLLQSLHCLDKEQVYKTYGYELCQLGPQKDYLDGKVAEAMKNPFSWFCTLDSGNSQRLINTLNL